MMYVVLNILLASTANTFLKKYVFSDHIIMFIMSFLLNSSSFAALYFCLRDYDLSTTQLLISPSVLVTNTLIGIFVFNENFTYTKFFSFVLTLFALILLVIPYDKYTFYNSVDSSNTNNTNNTNNTKEMTRNNGT